MSVPLSDGFSPNNIDRIYHGEPALVDDHCLPGHALGPVELRALTMSADGLTYKEVGDTLDRHDTNDILREGRNRLGILDTFQLAGYFPLDLEDEAVGSRKLTDLAEIPRALDVLEAISVGRRNKAVAAAAGITGPAVRGRLAGVEGAWGEDGLMSVRIANAIRARYVRALESRSGRINSRNISRFTLSSVAKLEPSLINAFPDLGVPATT